MRRNIGSCCYVTVGTGIGVGVYVNGGPVHGLVHPEAGHMMCPLYPGESQHFKGTCPFHGACMEGMANSISIAARKGIRSDELPSLSDDDVAWEIEAHYLAHLCAILTLVVSPEVRPLPFYIVRRQLFAAADACSRACPAMPIVPLITTASVSLSLSLSSTSAPSQVIVLGGGVPRRACLFPLIRKKFQDILAHYVKHPKILADVDKYIVPSIHGANSGIIGAMEIARRALVDE